VRPSSRLLAVLASLLLVLTGCGTAAVPGGAPATVDGDPVPRDRFEQAVRELTATTEELDLGQPGDELQRRVLALMIQARVIAHQAEEQGIEVDDAEIEQRYQQELEQAGGEDGLREMLAFRGLTPELFREELLPMHARVDVMRERLAADHGPLELRTVRHILVESEDEAQQIVAELGDGADFGELAEERSIDPGSGPLGGDLGANARGAFVPEFDEAAWAADVGEVVGPVESPFGFHVIEVTDEEMVDVDDLDLQQLDELVGPALMEIVSRAFAESDIRVDPAIGRWDPEGGVVAPERVGDGSGSDRLRPGDQPEPADDGLLDPSGELDAPTLDEGEDG
jgi:hypothetical protein